jgi:hypothetical protein
MFALSDYDLQKRILGCGDGPASFNTEMTARQFGSVISVDPLYAFSKYEIERRINETYDLVIRQTRMTADNFLWQEFADVEALGNARLAAMGKFIDDYERGKAAGRYVVGELPHLPFSKGEFDLCLCSHFLFLYSQQLSTEFHIDAVVEQLRVAREVRIFPLLDLTCERSRHVEAVKHHLTSLGYDCEIASVPYEFQRGGNQMMRITEGSSGVQESGGGER